MRKMFMRISLIACIGLVFVIGGMLSVFYAPLATQVAQASAVMHTLTVQVKDTDGNTIGLLNDELLRIRIISPGFATKPVEHLGALTNHNVERGSFISVIGRSDKFMMFQEFVTSGVTEDPSLPQPPAPEFPASEFRFKIGGTSVITAVFKENNIDYALTISARAGAINKDTGHIGGGVDVPLGNSVRVSVDGTDQPYNPSSVLGFIPMQTLDHITFNGLAGYKFESISIKLKNPNGDIRYEKFEPIRTEAGGTRYVFGQELDVIFFDQYLSLSSEIIIIIELTKLFKLDVAFAGASESMGTVTLVRIRGGSRQSLDHTVSNYLEPDDRFEITATTHDAFHEFAGFDRDRSPSSNALVDQRLLDDKIITVNFRAKLYGMDSDFVAVGFTEASMNGTRQEFRVGQTLVFTFDALPSNNVIKSWRIRNKAGQVVATVPKKDISASGISLTLTGDMLTGGKFEFVHDVGHSLDDGLIMAIAIPGAVVPVLLIVLIGFMVVNGKRKKIIKAQLEGRRTEKIKRDVGGYISDLRSGADTGKITKAQIKAEMKKQKGDKGDSKGKPQVVQKAAPAPMPKAASAPMPKQPPAPKQAPAPAPEPQLFETAPAPTPKQAPQPAPAPAPMAQVLRPTPPPAPEPKPAPAPAAPQAAPLPRLTGTKMTADRSIVDGGGNVVAKLQPDGSIADKDGKVFAKIRMTDGAIVGLDDKVLGVVQGDGSIK